jgi:hypothetical protein
VFIDCDSHLSEVADISEESSRRVTGTSGRRRPIDASSHVRESVGERRRGGCIGCGACAGEASKR